MSDIVENVTTGLPVTSRKDGFDNILNFRDVGKTINEFLGEK